MKLVLYGSGAPPSVGSGIYRKGIGNPILIIIALLASLSSALINDPVSQRVHILSYQTNLMNEHTSFDMSILDGTSLVQADFQSTYFLSKQCKNFHKIGFSLEE